MRKLIILITIYNLLFAINSLSDIEKMDSGKVAGSWINGDFYYSFDTKGVMRAIKIDSIPVFYQTYNYELFSMDSHEFIRYGKDLSDSASVNFLFVNTENDSVAMFAYCTPFVRADSAKGLSGEWIYVNGFSTISWNIGSDTIDYTQSVLDTDTGEFLTLEEHHGAYTRGRGLDDPGWYYIDFEDGKKAVVLPILFKDVLYMFDLNMSRAKFLLTENAPTYNDYKEAQKKF
ncbi:hypothetical protein ACFL6H_00870 [Candidatus Latescibacterota bacterium]